MRIGLVSLVLNACIFLCLRYFVERHWVDIQEWEAIRGGEVFSLLLLTITSVGLMSWSLFLLVGNAKFRDLGYGILGLAIGMAAPALWLLLDNAKPR